MTLQITTRPKNYLRIICNAQKVQLLQKCIPNTLHCYATTVDVTDAFTSEFLQRHKNKMKTNTLTVKDSSIRYFMDKEVPNDMTKMSNEELDETLLYLLSKNKDKQIAQLLGDCCNFQKFVNEITLKKLFTNYSLTGKPEMVNILQTYCAKVDPNLYKRNGGFLHYLAKAQCLKGNSEKGLMILKDSYQKNKGLRPLFRIIFRELIQDSVLNRSEASLVIFKKYVLEFSEYWEDHYPLVCFWHMCWSSSWFSDQMLSNELLELSKPLREIIRDKATAFSINILKEEYNEDAVTRLLQTLLKYNMMAEYLKVLQIFFGYKLRNRDIRGCTEIIRNCEALGVTLPSDQQGRYINMLINRTPSQGKDQPSAKPPSKDFKLKF